MRSEILARCLDAPILIVDDNQTNVLLLQHILRQEGYRNLHSTTDPLQVLPLHTAQHFDLILLDLMMPGLDGMGVMESLLENLDDEYLPVIVITALSDPDVRQKALLKGARDFITKPLLVPEVIQRIRNQLEMRMLYHERRDEAVRLEAKVRERTHELEETQVEILRRLALAGEFRDNETGNHVLRVSDSCRALALAAGLDVATAESIRATSPMHDVGKIGIPDHILLKPGRLEGEDLQTMRTHAAIGARMLGNHPAPIMQMACRIAACHHEKWDGSGYPAGLRGNEIPIEARIVAICDVFDALTSARPYKHAWPVNDALAYIREQAGQHFDPDLVARFLGIVPEILAIRSRHED